jgi:translocator protein
MSIWRRLLGVFFLVYGFIALVTPFTPGSWLIFIGAEILGIEFLSRSNIYAFAERHAPWFIPTACIATPILVGVIGGLLTTSSIANWYVLLSKPWWTPPAFVFGPVWALLYLLMGIAAFLVWRAKHAYRCFALSVFFTHLFVNLLWSIVFFDFHAPLYAFSIIILLWGLIVWLIVLFARQSRTAAWLLVPYLLWVSYAMTLNLGIVMLN